MDKQTFLLGNLTLKADIYEKNDNLSLKEQIKILKPVKNNIGLAFTAEVHSMLYWRWEIADMTRKVFPFIEKDFYDFYDINKYEVIDSLSSKEEYAIKAKISNEQSISVASLYCQGPSKNDCPFDEILDRNLYCWNKIENNQCAYIDEVRHYTDFGIVYHSMINNCSGKELAEAFIVFIQKLFNKNIDIQWSLVKWEETNKNYYYELTNISNGVIIEVKNTKTLITEAFIGITKNKDTKEFKVTTSENWKDFE